MVNKKSVALGLLAASLLLVGCQGPKEKPEDVLKKTLEVSSAIDEMAMNGTLAFDINAEQGKNVAQMSATLDAYSNEKDSANPVYDMTLKLSGSVKNDGQDLGKGDVDMNLRFLNKNIYMKLNSLSLNSPAIPSEIIAQLDPVKGSWYEFPMSLMGPNAPTDVLSMKKEDKMKAKQALIDNNAIKITEDKGIENGMYHYAFTLDPDKTKAALAQAQGTLSDADKKGMDDFFAKSTLTGELWINQADKKLSRVALNLQGKDPSGSGKITLNVAVTYPTGRVVEKPQSKTYMELVTSLQGLMGGGAAAPTPSAPVLEEGGDQ